MKILIIMALLATSSFAGARNIIAYPDRAERLRISGEVNVLYDVSKEGRATNIRFVSADPEHVFNRSIKQQISNWRHPKGAPLEDVPLKVIFKAN